MIYVLDKKTWSFDPTWANKKQPFQYIDLEYFIKEFLFKDEPTVVHNVEGGNEVPVTFVDKILTENPEIKVFACNLDSFNDKYTLLMYDERICKKYPDVFFIFFYHELDFTFLADNKASQVNNIIYVLNSFNTNKYDEIDNKVFPYYLINSYLQKNYEIMQTMYYPNYNLKKAKKYNFLNGVHKSHRFAAYELIKKYDLLNDGFFSYLDYTDFLKEERYRKETANWLNISLEEFEKRLTNFEIPYLLETFDGMEQPGIFAAPFLIPPIYSWQSYISITSETNYIESSNIVSLSEKSFKAFSGFNIPLIYGQPCLVDYLKHLGFDMFDDLFDNTIVSDKAATLTKLDKNIQTIKNMSIKELHNFYVNNFHRIDNNFNNLMHVLRDKHFTEIKNNVNKLLNK